MDKTKAVMEERMSGGKSKTVVYPFDEAVHYTNEGLFFCTKWPCEGFYYKVSCNFHLEFGLDETRMLTRVAPGRYKMVTKTKTGKTGDFEMNFTEHGVFETMTVGGLSASCFYRYLLKFSNNKEMIKTLIPCQFLLITVTPTTPHNRRLGDFEGTWKVCSKVGAEGYLDACGVLDND